MLEAVLKKYQPFYPVIPFHPPEEKLLLLCFSEQNTGLTDDILKDTRLFGQYIQTKLFHAGVIFGIGGYLENRTIYRRSELFAASAQGSMLFNNGEARTLHLGIDVWGRPYTPVRAPIDGIVHSLGFHPSFGDYGAVIILSHQLEGISFHTLYGHLSLNSIKNWKEGHTIRRGTVFAEWGIPQENGNWPPHLHFQIIKDLQGRKGDYPGVCTCSEKEIYAANCPDPDTILQMMPYAVG